MGAVNHSELCRGDENRPPTPDISEYPGEWERLTIQSFVGAMKIARQPRILASTPMNGKIYPPRRTRKNHPPAGKTSSGRVIDIMGDGVTTHPAARKA